MSVPGDASSVPLVDSPADEVDVPIPSPSIPAAVAATSGAAPLLRIPSLRSISDPPGAHVSSTPLGPVSAARRGPIPIPHTPFAANGGIPKDFQARLQAFQQSRLGSPPQGGMGSPVGGKPFPPMGNRPSAPTNWTSAPVISGRPGAPKPTLAQRRINVPTCLPESAPSTPGNGGTPASPTSGMRGKRPHPGKLSSSGGLPGPLPSGSDPQGSLFDKYSQFIDKEAGSLRFAGKAILHGKGVEFSSGTKFNMSPDEIQTLEELGKGNYGTVYRVMHRGKPTSGRRASISREQRCSPTSPPTPDSSGDPTPEEQDRSPLSRGNTVNANGTVMAMKEIRLELDENKFAQIIMELDVLHRCRSPYIIDFYGAFFQEGAVYICMEHMDGGSIDKLYYGGVGENVLRKITFATVMGLKSLKEEHNIIHRDVKPTNILVNTRGDVKLCDFGVSGNLVASIAKTNIGCQSYMAPERIASGGAQPAIGETGTAGTYGVQSDIWSLGLSILECAMGCYPYPPETYNNIFSQLSAIVDGEPPDLPEEGFSPQARDFVRGCLHKIPKLRPTYAMLLQHPWISDSMKPDTISEESEEAAERGADFEARTTGVLTNGDLEVREWVIAAMEKRKKRIEEGIRGPEKPALHAAPLDAVPTPSTERQVELGVEGVTAGVGAISTD